MTAETMQVQAMLMKAYREDPCFFVEHALGHLTWTKQREILMSVRDNPRTAIRACHGSSKTFTAAEVAVWFLNVFDNAKVITTAPTYTQMKMLLWSEINAAYATSRIKLSGECLMTEIKTDDPNHYAIGFSTDKPARAEGWHAPAILFIFDEAKGIPQWLWDSVRGLLTGGHCRWLTASTTDGIQTGEQFWKIFQQSESGWQKVHIKAEDTPYCTGEEFQGINIPDLSRPDVFYRTKVNPSDIQIQISGPGYIADCTREWGRDSVLFQTKVEGEIIDAGADSIVKLSQAQRMFENFSDPAFDSSGQEEIGVDVARGGTDDTVMFKRKGMKIIDHKIVASKELPPRAKLVYIADEAAIFSGQNKKTRIKIDDTGVGGGVVDILQSRGFNIIPVNFGAEPKDKNKYPNAISEMWFEAGASVGECACPRNDRLLAELTNRKQKCLDKQGRRVVESKDDYKARGFRSPDEADAFLLTFYNPNYGIPMVGSISW